MELLRLARLASGKQLSAFRLASPEVGFEALYRMLEGALFVLRQTWEVCRMNT